MKLKNKFNRNKKIIIGIIGVIIALISIRVLAATMDGMVTIKTEDKNLYNALIEELGTKIYKKNEIMKTIEASEEIIDSITKLNFSNKNIEKIKGLEKFKNLADLNLHNNKIEDISALKNLDKLEILDLSNNILKDDQIKVIGNIKSLKELNLKNNKKITNVVDMSKLNNLTILDLQDNKIQSLNGMQSLENIEKLRLSNNNIESINELKQYVNIKELTLANNSISDMTAVLNMKKLEELDLSGNEIENIISLKKLEKLEKIDISKQTIYKNISGVLGEEKNITIPSIIEQVKNPESTYYSEAEEKIIYTNCNLNEDYTGLLADPEIAAKNDCYIEVKGGMLDGTKVVITGTTISYEIAQNDKNELLNWDINVKTNQNIIAKVVTNNKKLKLDIDTTIYTFTDNGSHEFIINQEGFEPINLKAEVNCIDKITPEADINYITSDNNDSVIVEITSNEEMNDSLQVNGWRLSADKKKLSKTYVNNTDEIISIMDLAGNIKEVPVKINSINENKPICGTLNMKEESETGVKYINGTWTNKNIYIELKSGKDRNGKEAKTTYSINNGEEETTSKILKDDGEYNIRVRTTDENGNKSENQYLIKIDKTNPKVGEISMSYEDGSKYTSGEYTNQNIGIIVKNGTDSKSGHNKTEYTINGINQTQAQKVLSQSGQYDITVKTTDNAGNYSKYDYKVIIDRTSPRAYIMYEKQDNGNLKSIIKANEAIQELPGWELSDDETYLTKIYNVNKSEELVIKDKAGNEQKVSVNINDVTNTDFDAEITYSKKTFTNENVTVTISSNRELKDMYGWNISADRKSLTKIYTSNATENVSIYDIFGNYKVMKIEVNNITNSAPNVQVIYSETNQTKNNVTVTLKSDRELEEVNGFQISTDRKSLIKEYSENIEENVEVYDLYGNKKEVNIKISNIIEDDLFTSVKYSTTSTTDTNVLVTIEANRELAPIDGWTYSDDKKSLSRSYAENKTENILVSDTFGNTKSVAIEITNIDSTEAKASITYSTTDLTKENVTITIVANKQLVAMNGWSLSDDKKCISKIYTSNIQEGIEIKDVLGNVYKTEINIDNILPKSSIYNIDGDKIINVLPNTLINDFKANLGVNIEVPENLNIMKTGIKVKKGDKEYIVVVDGDIDGDGKITILDMFNLGKNIFNGKQQINNMSNTSKTNILNETVEGINKIDQVLTGLEIISKIL